MKLTKAQRKTLDDAAGLFDEAASELHDAVAEYNDLVTAAWEALHEKRRAFDEVRSAFVDAAASIAGELTEAMDEKSEKWHEGDAGQSAHNLVDALESLDPDVFDPDEPVDLDAPESRSEDVLEDVNEHDGAEV